MNNGKIRHFLIKVLPYGMTKKLFFLIIAIGAFLMVSLVSVVTGIFSQFLYDGTKDLLRNQTRQVLNVFDQHMDSLKKIVMTAENQNSFKQLINGKYSDYESYSISRDSYDYIKTIHEFYKWASLYTFVVNDHYVMGSKAGNVSSNFSVENSENTFWYREAYNSLSNITIISDFVPPVTGGNKEFAYILTVRDLYSWNIKGFIAATLNKSVLDDMLKNTDFQQNGFMVILDDKGRVAYTSNETLLTEEKDLIPDIEYFSDKGTAFSDDSLKDYYMVSMESSVSGWRFVSFADKKYLKQQVLQLQMAVLVLVFIGFILLLTGARVVSGMITKPINKLITFIHGVEKTEFSQKLNVQANDEVGELVGSFNMLIDSVRENQVLRRKAEIDALQKQIDPHFLFNTLESIKALAIRQDTNAVCDTIDRLGDMFRYNTNRENKSTTCIYNEVELISDYLHIQKVRFGDRLNFRLEIDPSILQNSTLKFILQPIVENSIRHGMEIMEGHYLLVIRGYEAEKYVVFEIIDNGPGIALEKLEEMKCYIYDRTGTVQNNGMGIGLKNIRERMSLFYSEKCGFEIESVCNESTKVTIFIPKQLNGDDNSCIQ